MSAVCFAAQNILQWCPTGNGDHGGITLTTNFELFFESRNNDDKLGSFVAAQVNELVCTSELGE